MGDAFLIPVGQANYRSRILILEEIRHAVKRKNGSIRSNLGREELVKAKLGPFRGSIACLDRWCVRW